MLDRTAVSPALNQQLSRVPLFDAFETLCRRNRCPNNVIVDSCRAHSLESVPPEERVNKLKEHGHYLALVFWVSDGYRKVFQIGVRIPAKMDASFFIRLAEYIPFIRV